MPLHHLSALTPHVSLRGNFTKTAVLTIDVTQMTHKTTGEPKSLTGISKMTDIKSVSTANTAGTSLRASLSTGGLP